MKRLEIHIIQNVAPANLNRDDTGSPKDAIFGGYRRARLSSQSQKRAVRQHFKTASSFSPEDLAERTRLLLNEKIVPALVEQGRDPEEARKAGTTLLELMKKKESGFLDEEGKTKYLLFLGNKEIEQLINLAVEHYEELAKGKLSKTTSKAILDAFKEILNGGKAVDLALFGRMLADRAEWNVDAAAQVAHAISTHKVEREFDFYTAVDDLSPEDETGAGMMGDVEFYSATFYRYANLDLGKLQENLQEDGQLAASGVEAFLRAFVETLPSGKQNTFAAHNPPDLVYVVVREGAPRNLANAFVKPVWSGREDLVHASVKALDDYAQKLNKAYGDTSSKALVLNLSAYKPQHLGQEVETFADLVNEVMAEVRKALEV